MKIVGTCLYVHKSSLNQFLDKISYNELRRIYNYYDILKEEKINFTIVKYDKKTLNISFIYSPDWDVANEPTVGDSICINIKGERKLIKGTNKIYHNKYLFVNDTYDGFNIEESKKRSALWNSIPNIKIHKSRIGNKDYWHKLLLDNNIPI